MGERVTVYDERRGLGLGPARRRDGYVGYLPSDGARRRPGRRRTARVAALRTFVYPGPNLKLPPIARSSASTRPSPVAAIEGDLARLGDAAASSSRAHLAPLDAREPDFVAVAERFLGAPYLWGGKTSLGLDCSGLVQLALAAAGIAAPRDTDMQEAALGRPVALAPDLAGLRRGDLVFWKGHVGMMLDARAPPARQRPPHGGRGRAARRGRGAHPLKSFGPIVAVKRLELL